MATALKLLYEQYHIFMDSYSDPRSDKFFLAQSPFIPLAICFIYLRILKKWGPNFMKNRPAFNLNWILIVYNLVQVVLSARFVFLGAKHTYIFGSYKLQCEPVDYSNNWLANLTASEIHNYYLMKILDLLDTVFFVLRKKKKQVTFLHVYHHIAMIWASWIAVRFIPGGHVVFIGFINSFVHIFMYTYYLLATLNKSFIWWKKYITILQIIQFGLIAVHWVLLVIGPSCGFPKPWSIILIPQNAFMFWMFVDFYYNAYIKSKNKK